MPLVKVREAVSYEEVLKLLILKVNKNYIFFAKRAGEMRGNCLTYFYAPVKV